MTSTPPWKHLGSRDTIVDFRGGPTADHAWRCRTCGRRAFTARAQPPTRCETCTSNRMATATARGVIEAARTFWERWWTEDEP